jgi:hypothetical protein
MKRFMIAILFLAAGAALFACTVTYTLDGQPVTPGVLQTLSAGTRHILSVVFTPDHGNCPVPAEDTIFLVNDEKWKAGKDYLPVALEQNIVWKPLSPRSYETVISFKATAAGDAALEVIRECTRGGYDETLRFAVR